MKCTFNTKKKKNYKNLYFKIFNKLKIIKNFSNFKKFQIEFSNIKNN